tara:strand:- start:1137 stop:1832 length:696 start_codon:yes stop_codon:yes gene_type:complete
MSIKLNAQSGGSVALDAPTQTTSSADLTFKLPVADGSANQVIKTDGSGNLSFANAPDTNDFVKLQNVASTTTVDHITFTNLDTTTYKAFRLVFAGLPGTDGARLTFRFMSGSNIASASNYSWAIMGVSGDTAHYESMETNVSSVTIDHSGGNASFEGWRTIIDIVPQTTNDFEAGNNFANWIGNRRDGNGSYRLELGSLYYKNDTDTDGFKLAPDNGSFNKYSYTLYGVKR